MPDPTYFELVKQILGAPKNLVVGLVRDKAATEKKVAELGDRCNVHILHTDLTNYREAVDELKKLARRDSLCQTGVLRQGEGIRIVPLYMWCWDIMIQSPRQQADSQRQ